MPRRFPKFARRTALALLALSLILAVAAVAGCSSSSGTATPPATPAGSTATGTPASSTAEAQLCAECGGLGAPPVVTGEATDEGGVQVLSVAVVGGYYSPNDFKVKAGTPVKVVFTGSAKGCVAKPKFADLGKQVDITGTGTGTIELGALDAGTYHFTCGMGVNQGTITVQ